MFSLPLFSALAAQVVYPNAAASRPCSCSSGFIPVPVDVTLPANPSNPHAHNSTDTFRLRTTFQVFGFLCEPVSTDRKYEHAVQLLLHGQTYTSQYWDVTWGGFQNYSYITHSCKMGISSFAYDNTGAGRTRSGGPNLPSTDIQVFTAGNVSSSLVRYLKSGRVSKILTGKENKFQKVVGLGHSLGSVTLNYAAVGDGAQSPLDGLVLTGWMHHTRLFALDSHTPPRSRGFPPASEVNPNRGSDLDLGYITTLNIKERLRFYGPAESFSPTLLRLDELTKDVGSKWTLPRPAFTPAFGLVIPVVELVGSLDKIFCLPNGQPCNQAELQISEAVYFPNSINFTMVVLEGYGHDVNLDLGAAEAFRIMTQLLENVIATCSSE